TVTPSTATGKITFYDGATILGTNTLVASQAVLTTKLLISGIRVIHAYYSGDSVVGSGHSPMMFQTVRALPQTGLQAPVTYNLGIRTGSVGDFNGDGKADLVGI